MPESIVRKVIFLSQHALDSDRRAGFHWLAESFWLGGWDVVFVTTAISQVSKLRKDRRLAKRPPWGRLVEIAPRLSMYIEPALIHPFKLDIPVVGTIATQLMSYYGTHLSDTLRTELASADMVIFESNASVLMFDAVRAATDAVLVYRVSDDVRVIRNSPLVPAAEDAAIDKFDLVSVPSRTLLRERFGEVRNAKMQPHGIPKVAATDLGKSCYETPGPHATSIGSTLLDTAFLEIAPQRRPGITFHQVGQMRTPVHSPKFVEHGEVPFARSFDFASQADICLALYEDKGNVTYLAETSNKLAIYKSLRKRIVAPEFLRDSIEQPGTFFYDISNPESIDAALDAALAFNEEDIPLSPHRSWDTVRDEILEATGF